MHFAVARHELRGTLQILERGRTFAQAPLAPAEVEQKSRVAPIGVHRELEGLGRFRVPAELHQRNALIVVTRRRDVFDIRQASENCTTDAGSSTAR